MKAVFTLLFVIIFGASTALAEVEFVLGGGYVDRRGSENSGFFHSQLGWKQIYDVPLIITADLDVGGNSDSTFINLDLNTALYYKRFAFGVGWGYQWYNDYDVDLEGWDGEYLYVKPNISLNFQYMKFSIEGRVFFDKTYLGHVEGKDPELAFTISLRDFGAVVGFYALAVLGASSGNGRGGGNIYISSPGGGRSSGPEWGEINLNGGAR
jgi:hypothetical protein